MQDLAKEEDDENGFKEAFREDNMFKVNKSRIIKLVMSGCLGKMKRAAFTRTRSSLC